MILSLLPNFLADAPIFVAPLLQDWKHWYLLLLPLCAAISVVYKCVKCDDMRQVPRQSTIIFLWIVGGMVAGAVILQVIVAIAEALA